MTVIISAARTERALQAGPAADAVDLFLRSSRDALVAGNFGTGCPIAGVALDLDPGEPDLRRAVAAGFDGWRAALVTAFDRDGLPPAQARRLARFVIAGTEGALILARAERDVRPFDDVAREVGEHVRTVLGPG